MRVKATEGDTGILRWRDGHLGDGWAVGVTASALGSSDNFSESLTLSLGTWGGSDGRETCWSSLAGFEWQ